MKKYDYLIIGAGLFGSVCAYELAKAGNKCLVVDKRDHIGGNCYTEKVCDINVHKYGPHIFHTNNELVWDYINQFAEFNNFINSPLANYKGRLYNLPFNMNTFQQMWGCTVPQVAKNICYPTLICHPENLEEQALSMVCEDIYNMFIKGYSEKQWLRKCTELPPDIIKRIPLRFTYDNNYFNDKYQGIPIGGYTQIFEQMLNCGPMIDVELNCNLMFPLQGRMANIANKIICTCSIDEFYGYKYGKLEYIGREFVHDIYGKENAQGVAVINYTDIEIPWLRKIEHKHFEFGQQPNTVITTEYSKKWQPGGERYYPINNSVNQALYTMYEILARKGRVIFGGRLGTYQYLNMDQIVAQALATVKLELKNK